jgi:hypothetical protein
MGKLSISSPLFSFLIMTTSTDMINQYQYKYLQGKTIDLITPLLLPNHDHEYRYNQSIKYINGETINFITPLLLPNHDHKYRYDKSIPVQIPSRENYRSYHPSSPS